MSIKSKFPSIRPSLLLDFANSKQLDPRITFTRASTATYWDGVTQAKAEENLLLRSQEFDNSYWGKAASTVSANATAAPDDSMTADTVSLPSNLARIERAVSGLSTGAHTFSIYIKGAPGETVNVEIGAVRQAVTMIGSWQRVSVSSSGSASYTVSVIRRDTTAASVEVWGAQLEQRDQATAYTPTTDQPITKYQPVLQTAASGVPRFDHNPVTGESLGLLIEEQRTNLVTQSAVGSGWISSNVTRYSNNIVAPDGVLAGTTLQATAGAWANRGYYQAITVTAGAKYTASVYARAGTYGYLYIGGSAFNVSNGTVMKTVVGGSATITDIGGGWYRCVSTYVTASVTDYFVVYFADASGNGAMVATGDETINVWGAQLEAGAFPTSYIPTTTAQVTRAADAAVMTGTDFSSWYRQNEGTLFALAYPQVNTPNSVDNDLVEANDGTQANYFGTRAGISTGYQANQLVSVAANGVSRARNGALVAMAQPTSQPPKTRLQIGAGRLHYPIPGWYQRIAYYPKRLPDAQLQALTA